METSLSQTDISLVQLPIRVIFNWFSMHTVVDQNYPNLKDLPVASLIINKGKKSYYDDIIELVWAAN